MNKLVRMFERGQTFNEILLKLLPPSVMESVIVCKLLKLEDQLSAEEKLELRMKLIELATSELFYPLRKIVLIEKEKQESIAEESTEMQYHFQKEGEYLLKAIANAEVKLQEAESNISQVKSDIENMKTSAMDVDTRKEEQEKESLLAKLQELKEKMAFNEFILDLPNLLRPEKTVQTLREISKLNIDTTVPELMQQIFNIFEIAKGVSSSLYLNARIARDLNSDKEDLLRVLEGMKELSCIDIDAEGDLIVQGGNIILSSVLPKVITIMKGNEGIQQLKICCRGNFVLDISLDDKCLSGKNVIIVADNIASSESKVFDFNLFEYNFFVFPS